MNNIVVQDKSGLIADGPVNSQVTFSNNLWSQTPPAAVSGTGDFVGDAGLANGNVSLVSGGVRADWFKIQTNSPAIDGGAISGIGDDYFGNGRSNLPDIGAHESQ
jgi:hypothetical protein